MASYFSSAFKVLTLSFLIITGVIMTEKVCADEIRAVPSEAIRLGERLEYKITWLRIPVAIGELWVKEKTTLNGREVFHVIGKIETNKVLSKILPMHDEAHSWIDAETLESLQFEKNIHELTTKLHERAVFDRAKGKGYLESLTTGKKSEFDVAVPVHDVISVIFWVRRQALVPGESVKTVLSANQQNWELEAKVLRKETVKVHGTKVKTFRVQPDTVVGGVERRGFASFNVTDDSARIPVRGTYKAAFGRVVGTLK